MTGGGSRRARSLKRRAGLIRRRFQGGFHQAVEDPGVALSLDMDNDSRTLLIAFGGMKGQLGMPPFEFFRSTGEIPVKRLFVRDLRQAWYHEGIPDHGTTLAGTAESLIELIAGYDVGRIVATGSSAGGYAALVFGTLLGADTVLGFAPQTTLDLEILAGMGDHRWDEPLGKLAAAGSLDPAWTDLRRALPRARRADTRYELYFAETAAHGRDRIQAEHLLGLDGVRLFRFGRGEHRIARALRQSGALDKVLQHALLAPGDQPAGDRQVRDAAQTTGSASTDVSAGTPRG